ncbi:MAG: FkbM family methyltransferase [Bacteroidota bacterium]
MTRIRSLASRWLRRTPLSLEDEGLWLYRAKHLPAWRVRKRLAQHLYWQDLAHLIGTFDVDLVLDVGANRGQFGRDVRARAGYTGEMHSFEPLPAAFKALRERVQGDAAWTAHPFALGAEAGEAELQMPGSAVLSSFLAPAPMLQQMGGLDEPPRTETVQVCRLDDVFNKVAHAEGRRILLKMDTQGFDLQVFAGAGDVLESVVVLQSEISVVPIYEEMPPLTESLRTYTDAGFRLSGLYPITTLDKRALTICEFDALFAR